MANDGFDLGAQRRPIAANDLPKVQVDLAEYLSRLRTGESVDTAHVAEPGVQYTTERRLVVGKDRVAESGEYNLSGERYREVEAHKHSKWPMVELGDVCHDILSGGTPSTKNEEYWKGNIPWITSADIVDLKTARPRKHITEEAIRESATNLIKKGNVVVVTRVGLGKLFRNDFDVCISQDSQGLIVKDEVNADYLVYILKDRVENFKKISQGSTIQGVTKKQLSEIQIPLPLLKVQQKIVAEIEGYQKVINGACQIIHNYRPTIAVDPKWPLVPLGSVCNVVAGQSPPGESYNTTGQGTPFYQGKTEFGPMCIGEPVKWTTNPQRFAETGNILMSVRAPVGPVNFATEHVCIGRGLAAIKPQENNVIPMYAFYILRTMESQITGDMGATFASISKLGIEAIPIPLPPMAVQQAIVKELEVEQSLVDANRELSDRMERKIQFAIHQVWGK